jgi:hypothetical protein
MLVEKINENYNDFLSCSALSPFLKNLGFLCFVLRCVLL